MSLASQVTSRLPVRFTRNLPMLHARRYHPTMEPLAHDVATLKTEMRQLHFQTNRIVKVVDTTLSELRTFGRRASHEFREARREVDKMRTDTLGRLTKSADILNGQLDAMSRFQGRVIFTALSASALLLSWKITPLAIESLLLAKRSAEVHNTDVD